MALPPADADGDLRLDWSDADLFAFLETLGTTDVSQEVCAMAIIPPSQPGHPVVTQMTWAPYKSPNHFPNRCRSPSFRSLCHGRQSQCLEAT